MRYGTYSTFDVPYISGEEEKTLEYQNKAFAYLKKEFEQIGGRVRLITNPHELGSYPSFEVDYPVEIEEIKDFEDELEESDTPEDVAKLDKLDDWHEKAREIETNYGEKFTEVL